MSNNPTCIRKHSVLVEGHETSVSIENAFWCNLRNIAREKNPDDESRLFYVGATRAKQHLHIVRPKDNYKGYKI